MHQDQREPIFNVPGVVAGVVAVLAIVHAGRGVLRPVTDNAVLALFGFNAVRYSGSGGPMPGEPWAAPVNFVSHALLHGDLFHLAINSAWLLAVGSPIARRMTMVPFLGYFALCAAGGALLFLVLNPGLDTALVGASGAISGLMGGVFRLMFAAEDAFGRRILTEQPMEAPRLSLRSMFTRRAPLIAIGGWVVVNFITAVALGSLGEGNPIAWEAHVGGFFVGLVTFDLFDRGNPNEDMAAHSR